MLEISGKTNLLEQKSYKYSLQDIAEPNLHRDISLKDIAENLEVSYHTINDPTIEDVFGALHTLFRMEEIYGLLPDVSGSKVRLTFESTSVLNTLDNTDTILAQAIKVWCHKDKQYRSGKISIEEYEDWKSKFPEFSVLTQSADQTNK